MILFPIKLVYGIWDRSILLSNKKSKPVNFLQRLMMMLTNRRVCVTIKTWSWQFLVDFLVERRNWTIMALWGGRAFRKKVYQGCPLAKGRKVSTFLLISRQKLSAWICENLMRLHYRLHIEYYHPIGLPIIHTLTNQLNVNHHVNVHKLKFSKTWYSYLLNKRTVLNKRIYGKIWPKLEVKNLYFHSFD